MVLCLFFSFISQVGRNRGEVQEQRESSWGSAAHRRAQRYGFWERNSSQKTGGRYWGKVSTIRSYSYKREEENASSLICLHTEQKWWVMLSRSIWFIEKAWIVLSRPTKYMFNSPETSELNIWINPTKKMFAVKLKIAQVVLIFSSYFSNNTDFILIFLYYITIFYLRFETKVKHHMVLLQNQLWSHLLKLFGNGQRILNNN